MTLPDLPTVTLVVAMYNEEESIAVCLGSLAAQDYPADRLEVLVFDGGSSDSSVPIAESIAQGRPGWSVRSNPKRIQAAAWNLGITAASGDLVGIVSGHACLAPSYVSSAVDAIKATAADMVGGPVRAHGEGLIGEAVAVAISTPFGVGGARHHYLTERGDVDTVFMGICRRETYLRFPFDETMVRNQDDELSYRLLDAGGRIVCDPAIQSSYTNRSTLVSLWSQFYAYGWWKVDVVRKHPRQARLRHFVPTGLVGALIIGSVAGLVSARARRLTALTLGSYVVSTIVASVRFADRSRPRSALALIAVFPTLHVGYGTGMIAGFVNHVIHRHPHVSWMASGRFVADVDDQVASIDETVSMGPAAGERSARGAD